MKSTTFCFPHYVLTLIANVAPLLSSSQSHGNFNSQYILFLAHACRSLVWRYRKPLSNTLQVEASQREADASKRNYHIMTARRVGRRASINVSLVSTNGESAGSGSGCCVYILTAYSKSFRNLAFTKKSGSGIK